jgi:hypothetical protein
MMNHGGWMGGWADRGMWLCTLDSGPAGRPDSKGVAKITPFATALTTPRHLGTGANAQSGAM